MKQKEATFSALGNLTLAKGWFLSFLTTSHSILLITSLQQEGTTPKIKQRCLIPILDLMKKNTNLTGQHSPEVLACLYGE
jgi:hypothetical protein